MSGGSVNRCMLLGHVGKDPEIRNTGSGDKIATLTIATAEQWKDRASGERKERTEWHRITVFNQALVRVIEQYVKKGAKLYLEGEVRTRKWTGRDGEDRFTTEVVLSNFGGVLQIISSPRDIARSEAPARQPSGTDQRGNPRYDESLNDEIPF